MTKTMQPMSHSLWKSQLNWLILPWFSFALVLLLSLSSACTEQEKTSLLQFLAGLSQDDGLATSWQNGTDCCTWEGITCNWKREVSEVSLPSRGLEGHISPSLSYLHSMLRLNLSGNTLTGSLPIELISSSNIVSLDVSFNHLRGSLQELPPSTPDLPLQVLNISSNFFTGVFPSATWEKTRILVALNVSNNSFSGWIPSFCISSPVMAVLDLSYNQFSGYINPGLGKCSALRVLKAGHNKLTGTLPDELFNATSLEYLSLSNNQLEGALEAANIIKLRNLAFLDLAANGHISGKVPDSIGQLTKLEELYLDHNNLSGEFPAALSKCTNLRTIELRNNNFEGELNKVNFSTLSNLRTLDLCTNKFTGAIPESLYSCNNLVALRLSLNKFNGQLSNRIANLKALTFISLRDNNFTNITNTLHILKSSRNLTALLIGENYKHEVLPQDETMDGFENLEVLGLDGCSFSGKLPAWLSKLKNLKMLLLSNNQLNGPIPSWVNTLHSLFYIDISNNSLTGEIPTALTEMPMLQADKTAAYLGTMLFELPVYLSATYQYRTPQALPQLLNLSSNRLTGVIPPSIGHMGALASLDLSLNGLSGEIPRSLCNLTNLQVLVLSDNHLTGPIPPELNRLHFLSELDFSNNDLEGPIPVGGQFETFSNSSFAGNPKLCGAILTRQCSSEEVPPAPAVTMRGQIMDNTIFAIAFSAFFVVGVMYDQIVLSKVFR